MSNHVISRQLLRALPRPCTIHQRAAPLRPYAAKRGPPEASEEDLAAARKWLANLNAETIPRSIGEVSFSRSSGPGGQNVNKWAEPSMYKRQLQH